MLPALARPPQNRSEHQDRKQEEHTHNLKQDLATHSLERSQESGDAFADIPCSLTRISSTHLRRCSRALLRAGSRARRLSTGDSIARHPARYAQANPKYPSNRLRFHFDMMVAAADISPPPRIQSKMPVAGVPLAK